MDAIPIWLLVVLVVVAVGAGLWVGRRAGELAPGDDGTNKPGRTLGARARDAAGRSVVSLWKWNRARKKKARERERS